MLGIAVFQPRHDAHGLDIVIEAAKGRHAAMQRPLAGMAEWRVAKIMAEGDRFGQILVEPQGAGHGARHLADFERMGQPVAEMIALVMQEDLRLVLQAAKGRGMDDAITIALEFRACRAGTGAIKTPERAFRLAGIRSSVAHR